MNLEVQKKLNELAELYRKNLPDKIQKIETYWLELQQNFNPVQFGDFHREVHSLCGSAGTYGYSELSHAARQMEVFLKTMLDVGAINNQDREKINDYLKQLHLVLQSTLSLNQPFFEENSPDFAEEKTIYIVEHEQVLIEQLREAINQIGFCTYLIKDIPTLLMVLKERPPTAVIIDTDYLDKNSIDQILAIQKKQTTSIPLFCILPNTELFPRLVAIRADCEAFFQKPVDIPYLTQILNYRCNTTPSEPIRVLIVDDSKSLTDYYSFVLNQAGMIVHVVNNPLQLLQDLEVFQPSLLLMDVYMPECTGFELAAVLRQESSYTKLPIIFLSTEEDADKKLFAISLGGDDFLTKPISPLHLVSAIRARSKRANILNYYMTSDSLTGLLNHSSILKQLDLQLDRAKQLNCALSFIMIDIDHFKKINDQYGHLIGDEVIKKLATLFLTRLRKQDIIGRYGGEEFALVLVGASFENAVKITNKLRMEFAEYCFKTKGSEFCVTFSAGISYYDGTNNPTQIIMQADQALYKAKQMGRNQVVVFTE